jgi:hypothetical protein
VESAQLAELDGGAPTEAITIKVRSALAITHRLLRNGVSDPVFGLVLVATWDQNKTRIYNVLILLLSKCIPFSLNDRRL